MTASPVRTIASIAIKVILLSVLPSISTAAESNEWFVRRSLNEFFEEALDSLPVISGGRIHSILIEPPLDNLGLVQSSFHRALENRGIEQFEDSVDGVEFQLTVAVEALDFAYRAENGTLFKRGDLFRTLDIAANVSLNRESSIVWQDVFVRRYEDNIDFANLEAIESQSSRMFWADPPPGPVQRLWEPAIVTAAVGGLVYLFFASR
jgi:hypothetical protein